MGGDGGGVGDDEGLRSGSLLAPVMHEVAYLAGDLGASGPWATMPVRFHTLSARATSTLFRRRRSLGTSSCWEQQGYVIDLRTALTSEVARMSLGPPMMWFMA
jgi:hypothetical protein